MQPIIYESGGESKYYFILDNTPESAPRPRRTAKTGQEN